MADLHAGAYGCGPTGTLRTARSLIDACTSPTAIANTWVFDLPAAVRAFLEQMIRDHLDVGRPALVALIFDRRVNAKTTGTFRTKVLSSGVDPRLCCCYKFSRLKQYLTGHRPNLI